MNRSIRAEETFHLSITPRARRVPKISMKKEKKVKYASEEEEKQPHKFLKVGTPIVTNQEGKNNTACGQKPPRFVFVWTPLS